MTDHKAEKTAPEFVVPTLVDLRLSGRLALAWLVAVGASGLAMALIVGESDGLSALIPILSDPHIHLRVLAMRCIRILAEYGGDPSFCHFHNRGLSLA